MTNESGPNPSGLCMCGCGEATNLYQGFPQRYRLGHHSRKSLIEYIEQDCGYKTPCWVWQRATDSHGYGQIRIDGQVFGAHRVYYGLGRIPDGYAIDHLCRNPSCVNPEHLEPVLPVENCRRGSRAKLTPEKVLGIRARLENTTETFRSIGRDFGVCGQTISDVAHGRAWSDVQ
jgi:hypothetical protein